MCWSVYERAACPLVRGRGSFCVLGVPRSMLFDLRVLMISSWEASPNCLVRFSDMLCRPKPSLRNAGSGSFGSGLRELRGQTEG